MLLLKIEQFPLCAITTNSKLISIATIIDSQCEVAMEYGKKNESNQLLTRQLWIFCFP